MTIPAEREAERDPALKGLPIVAYKNLLDTLDLVDFREVKSLWLESVLQCSERTVARVMAKLVEGGYIERGPWKPTEARTYRLRLSRARAA